MITVTILPLCANATSPESRTLGANSTRVIGSNGAGALCFLMRVQSHCQIGEAMKGADAGVPSERPACRLAVCGMLREPTHASGFNVPALFEHMVLATSYRTWAFPSALYSGSSPCPLRTTLNVVLYESFEHTELCYVLVTRCAM